MQKLKFIYQNWNRSYYELQSVKDTLWRHNNFYKNKMPKKLLQEHTKTVEDWAKFAYTANKEFMKRMWAGEFSLEDKKNPGLFNDKVDEIARIFNVTALFEETNQPYAYLELSGIFATLFFIDEKNRVYMQYSFQNDTTNVEDKYKEPFKKGNLFLVELEIFIFPEEKTDGRWKNRDYISYAFNPDGYLLVTKIFDVHGEHLIEKYEAKEPVNVTSNWEPYPKFGEWDSIFRMKRWKEGELANLIDENDNSNTKNEDTPSSEEPPKRPPGAFSVFD